MSTGHGATAHAFVLAALLCLTGCGGGIETVAATGVMALTGRQIIDEANRAIEERIHQAEQAASGLVNQTLTGLSALTEAARINLNDSLDRTLAEMTAAQRDVFLQIRSMQDQLGQDLEKAYSMEEVANVDVSQRLGGIVGIENAVFISSVRGLSVAEWEPSHTITVIGTGLGPGRAGETATVRFAVAGPGKELTPQAVNSAEHNTTRYIFSTELFREYFRESRVGAVDVMLTMDVERRAWWGLRTIRKSVTTHLILSAYPRRAGTLAINYQKPLYGYKVIATKTEGFRTADCGNGKCDRNEDRSTTPVANGDVADPPIGNRRVSNPRIACGDPWWDPAGCRYVYDWKAEVDASGRYVKAHWRVTGVWVTAKVSYDIEEYSIVNTAPTEQEHALEYGKVLEFCLPRGVETAVLEARLITGRNLQTISSGDVPAVLKFQARSSCPEIGGDRYSYMVLPPR